MDRTETKLTIKEVYPVQTKSVQDIPKWAFENATFTWKNLKEQKESLSAEEQLLIEDELYGLVDEVEETPELVTRSLLGLDAAIDLIEEKEAYETALFIVPEHVQDEKFRLAFLRADRFNVRAAARRMVDYWERKVELFGTHVAFKAGSSLLDLTEEDAQNLVKGGLQLLPTRDEFGRAIFYVEAGSFGDNVDSMSRCYWVVQHMAIFDSLEGVETQKNGLIQLWSTSQPDHKFHPFDTIQDFERFVRSCSLSGRSLPFRAFAFHLMMKECRGWAMMRLVERVLGPMGPRNRMRLELYVAGRDDENYIKFSNHGLLPHVMPKETGGDLEFDHKEWLYEKVISLLGAEKMDDEKIKKHPCLPTFLKLLLGKPSFANNEGR